MPPDHSKQTNCAVIVIHGVGDTGPGATLDALLPALAAQDPNLRVSTVPEVCWLPSRPYAKDNFFLVPIRKATTSSDNEVTFAEVYWADLSRGGLGVLDNIKEIYGVIFGLRHIADQAVTHNTRLHRSIRSLCFLASYFLRGPLLSLYVLLFVSALLANTLLDGDVFAAGTDRPAIPITTGGVWGFLGASLISFALVGLSTWSLSSDTKKGKTTTYANVPNGACITTQKKKTKSTRLRRMLLFCRDSIPLLLFLLVPSLFLVLAWFPWPSCLQFLSLPWFSWPGDWPSRHTPFENYAHVTVLAIMSVFTLVALILFAALVLAFCTLAYGRKTFPGVAIGAIAAQLMFWVAVTGPIDIWVIRQLVDNLPETKGTERHLDAHAFVIFQMILTIGLGACAFATWAAGKRLIVSRPALFVLLVYPIANVVFLFFWWVPPFLPAAPPWCAYIFQLLFVVYYFVYLPVFYALLLWQQTALRSVLHISADVVNHFHKAQDRFLAFPKSACFRKRRQIENRFRQVLCKILEQGNAPAKLVVVAHSQGTIIAVDVLREEQWTAKLTKTEVHLVTMGSPLTHLYQHYFPVHYCPLFEKGDAHHAEISDFWKYLRTNVGDWINLYRDDDYIGTHITGDVEVPTDSSWPKNISIGLGGHTNYWIQRKVVKEIFDRIKREP